MEKKLSLLSIAALYLPVNDNFITLLPPPWFFIISLHLSPFMFNIPVALFIQFPSQIADSFKAAHYSSFYLLLLILSQKWNFIEKQSKRKKAVILLF